jgi:DNA invertase Pin-like site-specific DNA recombinase
VRPRALTPQQETEALELKLGGASWSALARQFGVSEATVRRACRRQLGPGETLPAAETITPRKLTPAQAQDALTRHRSGESWASIARSLQVSPGTVRNAIRRLSMH